MFPTLSSITEYLFGFSLGLPILTFGFFVAVAFICSYVVFKNEFERKEQEGIIRPYLKLLSLRKAFIQDILSYASFGFFLGYKVFGAFFIKGDFLRSPSDFLFSIKGSWLAAIVLSVLFALLALSLHNFKIPKRDEIKQVTIHPHQLMPKLILWAAVWGFLGAKVFNYLENISLYSYYTWEQFWKYSGLTFYGGLVFGAFSFLYIGYKHGIKLIHLADIGSPGMLVAYGVGRIGCHLSGDGDWGIVNNTSKPFYWLPDWMWSFEFPHNVLNAGTYINGCTGKYCSILPQGVFPTSFYESFIILTIFLAIWCIRRRIKVPGMMFAIYLLIIGLERFLIEEIRVNFKYKILGFYLSEAQIVSLIFIITGVIGLYILLRKTSLAKRTNVLPV